ncbi:MAG: hypothetical protein LQ342_007935 [Letrouitia transgressa]|nr:MAG: hypothetical protein LQ342_007935 [Letrouitia transgressa]
MADLLQNANPTIRSASDLPTRRGQKISKTANSRGKFGLLDSVIPVSAYVRDPFNPSSGSGSDDSETDDEVEPIDEQEIYGTICLFEAPPNMTHSKPVSSSLSNITHLPTHISPQIKRQLAKEANILPFPTDLIAPMTDPEHPFTLGALSVVNLPDISLAPTIPDSPLTTVTVLLTPTITGCSLAQVIGLGVRIRLERALPPRFRVDVKLKEGSHHQVDETNKQLGDKERVAAAMENRNLMGVIGKMLEGVNNVGDGS